MLLSSAAAIDHLVSGHFIYVIVIGDAEEGKKFQFSSVLLTGRISKKENRQEGFVHRECRRETIDTASQTPRLHSPLLQRLSLAHPPVAPQPSHTGFIYGWTCLGFSIWFRLFIFLFLLNCFVLKIHHDIFLRSPI